MLISKGLLSQARQKAIKLIELLHPYASEGLPIIGLEPSCILTIADDLSSIITADVPESAQEVAQQCLTLDQFLVGLMKDGWLPFKETKAIVKVHGHCHQKALVGMKPTLELLRSIPGLEIAEIPSGCCGMAGSFGYEKEHYDISMKIGSLHLFPYIETTPADAIILANGFSCRSQIAHRDRPASCSPCRTS